MTNGQWLVRFMAGAVLTIAPWVISARLYAYMWHLSPGWAFFCGLLSILACAYWYAPKVHQRPVDSTDAEASRPR